MAWLCSEVLGQPERAPCHNHRIGCDFKETTQKSNPQLSPSPRSDKVQAESLHSIITISMAPSATVAAAEQKALEGKNDSQDTQELVDRYRTQLGVGIVRLQCPGTYPSPDQESNSSVRAKQMHLSCNSLAVRRHLYRQDA